jgi:DNA-binding HxlR family transcriptional regulator
MTIGRLPDERPEGTSRFLPASLVGVTPKPATESRETLYRQRAAGEVLTLIASKWTVLIIDQLADGPMRYNELRRRVGGVSQKVLTSALRNLERDGLVKRTDYPTRPPTVDYRLTDLGVCLSTPIGAIRAWADSHFEQILAARYGLDDPDLGGVDDRT